MEFTDPQARPLSLSAPEAADTVTVPTSDVAHAETHSSTVDGAVPGSFISSGPTVLSGLVTEDWLYGTVTGGTVDADSLSVRNGRGHPGERGACRARRTARRRPRTP